MALALSQTHTLGDPTPIFAMGGLGVIGLLLLGWLVLFVAALISILASPHTGGMKIVWLVLAFMAPFVGSLLWFVVGRGDAYRRSAVC